MLSKLKSINIKKAGMISVCLILLTVILHLLVIYQIMPYTWINGGRSASYEIARQTSITSIWVLLIDMIITLIAGKLIPLKLNKFFAVILAVYLWLQVPYTFFGFVLQLLGTIFEKCCMSLVVIAILITKLRMAVEKRW